VRVVVPSLHYGDFLAVTLPGWRAAFPSASILVVTRADDDASQAAATAHGCRVLVTDAWTRNGARLNVGAVLEEAFARVPPQPNEICLSVDADVYPCGRFPRKAEIKSRTLYGCARYHVDSQAELEAHLSGEVPRRRLRLIAPRQGGEPVIGARMRPEDAGAKCLGYFHCFRHSERRRYTDSDSAGGYDTASGACSVTASTIRSGGANTAASTKPRSVARSSRGGRMRCASDDCPARSGTARTRRGRRSIPR
jgi:hypothetical protein